MKKENEKKKLSVVVKTPLTESEKNKMVELLKQMFQEKYYS